LAIHGVLLGGVAALAIFTWKKKLPLWRILDIAGPALALAQSIGRWGNYFNQEIFGKPTDLPWGLPIQPRFRPAEYAQYSYFHPTVMYESFGNLIIFGLLGLAHWLRLKKKVTWIPEGGIICLYFMLYSVQRFLLEFLRTDYSPVVFGVRWAMIMSGLLFVSAAGVFVWRVTKQRISTLTTGLPQA
jgi:phosphatidylglycerol:prolipoprotein diacylglycerol transferase